MPLPVETDTVGDDFVVIGDREVVDGNPVEVDGNPVELGCRRDTNDDDEESVYFSIARSSAAKGPTKLPWAMGRSVGIVVVFRKFRSDKGGKEDCCPLLLWGEDS